MSRRRAFDIDAPVPAAAAPAPAPAPGPRRGPMASAVAETAAALAERAAAEAAIRAENDRLAAEYVAARRAGLVLAAVDPDAVEAGFLRRDRAETRDAEIDALKASIRAVGLSNPIRVAPLGGGRYALIQGWRRLAAWRELRAETADPAFDRIPAALDGDVDGEGALAAAYRRMVDENLVRREVSLAELAALARAYADERAGGDVDAAVDALFGSASPQKRSYVRAFVELMALIGDRLRFPEALPRALGLAVRARLRQRPETGAALLVALDRMPPADAAAEIATLTAWVEGALDRLDPAAAAPPPPPRRVRRIRLPRGAGEVRAAEGRLTLTAARDFSAVPAARMTAALEAFLALLDD